MNVAQCAFEAEDIVLAILSCRLLGGAGWVLLVGFSDATLELLTCGTTIVDKERIKSSGIYQNVFGIQDPKAPGFCATS
jgi:hypothetical protein